MDQIVLNTSQLKKQKDTLNSRKDYYTGKVSTFQGSKYNASSTLSSLLSKIRTNYTTIGSNIQNVSKYLEDYYKDAEGIEYKFNNSGGSIQTSSVNAIANQYYDVIEKYEFPTQNYFNLSFADSITSAVNNFFSFRKVVETDSVDFVMEDSLYNDVLNSYTEQIDMSIQEYETVAAELEKEIDSFSSLENLISMGAAVSPLAASNYNEQLSKALNSAGFSSLDEYQEYRSTLEANLASCEEAVRQLELSKITGKYDCLLFADNFQNYNYQGEISEEEIRNLSGVVNEYAPLSFDYDKIYESHKDVSLMVYVETLSKMYDESTIKAYATEEVWNAYELLEAAKVSSVEGVETSDYLIGNDFVKAYNYLFENYGREEASQYLTDIEDRVNQVLGQSEAMEKLAKLSSQDDVFSVFGNEVYVAGTGIGDGLQSWWENVGHAFSAVFSFFSGESDDARTMSKEEYEAQFFMQGLQQGNYSGPFLINNYEISQGIGNMLPSILITRGLGAAGVAASTASTAGSAAVGISAFGGGYHSSMVEGYSQDQALTYALISGSSEALFERFLGGILSDVKIVNGKTYLYSMAKEATEEGLQNIFDAGVRNVLFGEVQTGDELVESTLKSMLYGGITAGVLNSPSAISNSVKSVKVNNAIQSGSLDITNVITSLKNSGIDIEFDGKTDTQIISENVDIVYSMFKEQLSGVDNAVNSFNSQIANMNEEARTDNYNITKEKNSLDFKQYINNYLQKVSNFKFSDINFSERLKDLGDSIYSYFSGNYEIGTSDMTFENLDSQAELISDTLSYSDVDQLTSLLDSGQEGDLARVLVDGTLTANLDQTISNKALENFKNSSGKLIQFFTKSMQNIKSANQTFANMLAHATKLDSIESENLNGNLLGKFVGTFGYEFLSGTLMNKRKFTPVTNSKIMLDTIQNEGILHFTSPSTADKIMESGMIKKSGILTSDMTSPKSFFFGGTPTFEDLLINVPAYDVMTAVKIHPTSEQISDLKYRPLNDRAVVYDGDFHFDPEQAEIVYYGLAYDKENNNIFLKQITKEEAQNYHVSEEVKAAYNYNLKGNSLLDEIKMNIYGLYAEYKHHQRLQQFVVQWEQKGLKLNEISDQDLYDLWNIKEASVLNKQLDISKDSESDLTFNSSEKDQDTLCVELVNDIVNFRDILNNGSFNDFLKKLNSITQDNVPDNFSSVFDYKKQLIHSLIHFGYLDLMNNNQIFALIQDTDILKAIIMENYSTDALYNLISKNLSWNSKTILSPFIKLDSETFNLLFDSKKISEVIYDMSDVEFRCFLSSFKAINAPTLWLSNNTIMNRIQNMSIDEFYSFMKNMGYFRFDIEKYISEGNDTTKLSDLLKTVRNKFYTDEVLVDNVSRINLLDSFLSLTIQDPQLKSLVEDLKNQKTSFQNQFKDKVFYMLSHSINNDQFQISNDGTFSLYLRPTSNNIYYNIIAEVDGKEITIPVKKIYKSIDVLDTLFQPQFVNDILADRLIIKDILPDVGKNNLCLDSSQGLQPGLNEIILVADGQQKKILVNFKDNNIDLNGYVENINTNKIMVESINPIGSKNVQIDDISKLYIVKYMIDGEAQTSFIKPGRQKELFSYDTFPDDVLDIDSFLSKNNLYGVENVSVRPATETDFKEHLYSIFQFDSGNDIFSGSQYGGDQVFPLIKWNDYLNKINIQSSDYAQMDICNHLMDQYFPDTDDVKKFYLLKSFNESGCGYIALANSLAVYFGAIENGKTIFKNRFGYDLLTSMKENRYNVEALAFDIFLYQLSNRSENIVDAINKTDNGINIYKFKQDIISFFDERGIKLDYNFFMTSKDERYLKNKLFYDIFNNLSGFNLLMANQFDLERLDGENKILSGDKALSSANVSSNKIQNVGGHAMIVTGIDENLDIIVSSWGKKYRFDVDSVIRNKEKFAQANIWNINFQIDERFNKQSNIINDNSSETIGDFAATSPQNLNNFTENIIQNVSSLADGMEQKTGATISTSSKSILNLQNTALKVGRCIKNIGKISTIAVAPLAWAINPALGLAVTIPAVSIAQDGLTGNTVKNSFLMTTKPFFVNLEGKKMRVMDGVKVTGYLAQNPLALYDLLISRFVPRDKKTLYFGLRSVNALQYLETGKVYGTTSQVYTQLLLKTAQKYGFIKNLSIIDSNVKTNLKFERFLLGVEARAKNKKTSMYDMTFERTDKKITMEDIKKMVRLTDEELAQYKITQDKRGHILFDYNVSIFDVLRLIPKKIKALKVEKAISLGKINIDDVIKEIKESGIDKRINKKSNEQIIEENVDFIYDNYLKRK